MTTCRTLQLQCLLPSVHHLIAILIFLSLLPMLTVQSGPPNCWKSENATACIVCQSRYRLKLDLTCQLCTDILCKGCDIHKDKCTSAFPGYMIVNYVPARCQDANCSICEPDVYTCKFCLSRFRLTVNNTCQYCAVQHCRSCPNNANTCTLCMPNYYLHSNGSCQTNNVPDCSNSYGLGACSVCIARYGFSAPNVCQPCTDTYCNTCRYDNSICIICEDLYGVSNTTTNQCIRCLDPKCVNCGSDANVCKGCIYENFYGLDTVNGVCSSCLVAFCQVCNQNIEKCQVCTGNHGVNSLDTCSPCIDPNCHHCPWNYTTCFRCLPEYGFENAICKPCNSTFCLDCWSHINFCYNCKVGSVMISNRCEPCSDSQCAECLLTADNCIRCNDGFGLTTSNECQACTNSPSNCSSCSSTDINICYSCPQTRYLQNFTSICPQCPQNCKHCSQSFILGVSHLSCTECLDNTTNVYYLYINFQCLRIQCGDFNISTPYQQCDNQVGRLYDGCSDDCTVENQFVCFDGASSGGSWSGSLCSFTGVLQMRFLDFERVVGAYSMPTNQFKLRLYIFPPLYVFFLYQNLLNQAFKINTTALSVEFIKYDPQSGIIQFTGNFVETIQKNTTIQISFEPNSNYPQYFQTPDNEIQFLFSNKFILNQPSDISLGIIILFCCYSISALSWIVCILGILLKRLAGIEAMFVMQVAYMSFFLMSAPMLVTFEQTKALKYVNGYNHAFIDDQDNKKDGFISWKQPYYTQFQFSQKLFINNFNFCMVFEFIAILMMIVTYIRLNRFIANNKPDGQTQPQQFQIAIDQLNKLVAYYEMSYQILMSSCILNLIYFILCCVLYFKNNQIIDAPSLIIFTTQILVLIFVVVKFCQDPTLFDYFRYSFKQNELAMKHYCIFIIILPSISVLLILFENMPYLALCPPGLMLLYTLLYRPYKELAENLRSAWNMLVMCSLLFFRVFAQMLCPEGQLNKTAGRAYLMVNLLALLPLTVVIAIISIVYYYWYYNYKSIQSKHRKKYQIEQYYKKILKQLVQINPRLQIKLEDKQSTFRELINPKSSLLSAVNELEQLKILKGRKKGREKEKSRELESNKFYELQDLEYFKKEIIGANGTDKERFGVVVLRQGTVDGEMGMTSNKMTKCDVDFKNNGYNKYNNNLKNQSLNRINNIKNLNFQIKNFKQLNIQQQAQPCAKPQTFSNQSQLMQLLEQKKNIHFQNKSKSKDQSQGQDQGGKMMENPNGNQSNNQNQTKLPKFQYDNLATKQQNLYMCIECPQKLQKHMATDILGSEQKYVRIQAAINKTKEDMKEIIDEEIIEEYNKINTEFAQILKDRKKQSQLNTNTNIRQ